jgi:hypothetical protein
LIASLDNTATCASPSRKPSPVHTGSPGSRFSLNAYTNGRSCTLDAEVEATQEPSLEELEELFSGLDLDSLIDTLAIPCVACGARIIPRLRTRRTCSDRCRKRLSRARQS